jgi:hypothetical protein
MTSRKGVPTGQGYNFGGAKAKIIKARMREIKTQRERTGRDTAFGKLPEQGDDECSD